MMVLRMMQPINLLELSGQVPFWSILERIETLLNGIRLESKRKWLSLIINGVMEISKSLMNPNWKCQ